MDHGEGNGDGEDLTKAAADKRNQTNGMENGIDDPFHQTKRGGYILHTVTTNGTDAAAYKDVMGE